METLHNLFLNYHITIFIRDTIKLRYIIKFILSMTQYLLIFYDLRFIATFCKRCKLKQKKKLFSSNINKKMRLLSHFHEFS